MSYKENLKITFYNREDNEELSKQYSEFLMINRDGEVFELVHNGRGEYDPSYEGDWIGYKINGSSKTDEYEAKAKVFDRICEAMDYHYPSANDRKHLNGYQHPKASLKDIDAIINSYESGESNELRE